MVAERGFTMDVLTIGTMLGTIGALTSTFVAGWVVLRGKRLDHNVEHTKLWAATYEKSLFDNRLPGYKSLWALTEKTCKKHVANLSNEDAVRLASELTNWYYRDGGILMTSETRDAFFVACDHLSVHSPELLLPTITAFSNLRAAMCNDLNSCSGPGFSNPSGWKLKLITEQPISSDRNI